MIFLGFLVRLLTPPRLSGPDTGHHALVCHVKAKLKKPLFLNFPSSTIRNIMHLDEAPIFGVVADAESLQTMLEHTWADSKQPEVSNDCNRLAKKWTRSTRITTQKVKKVGGELRKDIK
jgi:hypothetical protein